VTKGQRTALNVAGLLAVVWWLILRPRRR